MKICEHCGESISDDQIVTTSDGHDYCPDCLTALDYTCCDDCGAWVPDEDIVVVNPGTSHEIHVCPDCADIGYTCCDDCSAWVPHEDIVLVNPDTSRETGVCPDCADCNYTRCDHCGEYFEDFFVFISAPNITLCDSCGQDYQICSVCGDAAYEDDMFCDEDGDEWYCGDCWRDRESRSRINGYSYKPLPRFFTRHGELEHAPGELTFGVELEIDGADAPQDCATALMAAADEIYCKHDGSLSNGVEIVTHPCTLDYHLYQLHWKQLCSIATGYGFKSHDTTTCGLHVHVGRAQLGSTQIERDAAIGKVILLVDRLWDAIVPFTRRSEAKLDQWAARNHIPRVVENGDEAIQSALGSTDGRYYAVNLENYNTIEFRIFRGTLKRDTIAATLQLVSNLCGYAMSHDVISVLHAGWLDVVNFAHFDELSNYCKSLHLDHELADAKKLHLLCDDPADIVAAVPDREIRVGDTVVVNRTHCGDLPTALIGCIGTVTGVCVPSSNIVVEFPDQRRGSIGYGIPSQNLCLVAAPVDGLTGLPNGTRVHIGRDYSPNYPTAGLWGTYYDEGYGNSHVAFDDQMGGHNCDGRATPGHGLWLSFSELSSLHTMYIPA